MLVSQDYAYIISFDLSLDIVIREGALGEQDGPYVTYYIRAQGSESPRYLQFSRSERSFGQRFMLSSDHLSSVQSTLLFLRQPKGEGKQEGQCGYCVAGT